VPSRLPVVTATTQPIFPHVFISSYPGPGRSVMGHARHSLRNTIASRTRGGITSPRKQTHRARACKHTHVRRRSFPCINTYAHGAAMCKQSRTCMEHATAPCRTLPVSAATNGDDEHELSDMIDPAAEAGDRLRKKMPEIAFFFPPHGTAIRWSPTRRSGCLVTMYVSGSRRARRRRVSGHTPSVRAYIYAAPWPVSFARALHSEVAVKLQR